jgi:lipid II:glycine glycyltransferase (peptidoglycan interpeptide bridge formation enzyme)
VHTVEEILHLHRLFPEEVGFAVGVLDGEVLGGTVTFATPRVVHAQYIAAGERGREAFVLDAVFEHCIEEARGAGARFFDFGISTTDDGRRLNEGLHQFKLEFGGGGVGYETYELALNRSR